MAYSIHYHEEKKCIMVKVEGKLDAELLQQLAAEVSKMIRQKGCKCVLNDLRQAIPTPNLLEIYRMPKLAKNTGVNGTCKRALVVGDRTAEFHFLETVFLNQGHTVKLFSTKEEAEAWLLSVK